VLKPFSKLFAKKTNISVRVWEYGNMSVRILLTFYSTCIHFLMQIISYSDSAISALQKKTALIAGTAFDLF
jgi:hypothetical protein